MSLMLCPRTSCRDGVTHTAHLKHIVGVCTQWICGMPILKTPLKQRVADRIMKRADGTSRACRIRRDKAIPRI